MSATGLGDPRLALGMAVAAALAWAAGGPPPPVVLPPEATPPPAYAGAEQPPPSYLVLDAPVPAGRYPLPLPPLPRSPAQVFLAVDAPGATPEALRVVTPRGATLPLARGPRPGLLVGLWSRQQLRALGPPARVEATRPDAPTPRSVFLGHLGIPGEDRYPADHLRVLYTWWRDTPEPDARARADLADLLRARLLLQRIPDHPRGRRELIALGLELLEEGLATSHRDLPLILRPLLRPEALPEEREATWARLLEGGPQTPEWEWLEARVSRTRGGGGR